MPAINFTKFVDRVEAFEKPITIRARGKRKIYIGDTLHLFTGMRTPQCRRLKCSPQFCRGKYAIHIFPEGTIFFWHEDPEKVCPLPHDLYEVLAKLDGFESAEEMIAYFTHNGQHEFDGYIYQFFDNETMQHIYKSAIDSLQV